eukprot:CAMPEP_0170505762 /NCGR_PEP_ID=MMETSP0208-20121228/52149_1 /TAXON_ID=197538 /ORGANISM="Strombidium inclinatum, Strain S3" /LENGTH=71 /DNA_ID=CAMNT_0010786833 /DNA_START=635 /DNA_END=850 /DNA_ORIENTATION=-
MQVLKSYGKMIDKETLLSVAPFLANLLRDYLEHLIKPFETDRNEQSKLLQQQKDNPQKQEELSQKCRQLYQ